MEYSAVTGDSPSIRLLRCRLKNLIIIYVSTWYTVRTIVDPIKTVKIINYHRLLFSLSFILI